MTLWRNISQLHILANWNINISLHSRMNVCLLSHASVKTSPVMRLSTQNSWQVLKVDLIWFTFPETNIAPENRPSQKESSIPTIHFQVRTVSFREGNLMESELKWWNPFEDGSPNFLRRNTLNLLKNICLMIMRKLRIMWDSRLQTKKNIYHLYYLTQKRFWFGFLHCLFLAQKGSRIF